MFWESMLNQSRSRKLSAPLLIMALNKDGLHHRYNKSFTQSFFDAALSLIVFIRELSFVDKPFSGFVSPNLKL